MNHGEDQSVQNQTDNDEELKPWRRDQGEKVERHLLTTTAAAPVKPTEGSCNNKQTLGSKLPGSNTRTSCGLMGTRGNQQQPNTSSPNEGLQLLKIKLQEHF